MATKREPLIAIVGPTAVGKTSLAVDLCQRFGGEVINADSRQVYRGMDIGTAKIGPAERALVPHHLLDLCSPADDYSVRQFTTDAKNAISAIHAREHLPILVGGTGHYVASLTQGLLPPAVAPDPELRADLDRLLQESGVPALADRLLQVDPLAHAEIDLQNPRRLVRAIEVQLSTGKSIRELESTQPVPWRPLVFGLRMEREVLADAIAARTHAMFSSGLLDEIRRLLAAGFSWNSALGRSIGYVEGLSHLFGRLSREEAIQATATATRQYARRQMTWFRNRETVHWLDVDDNLDDRLIKAVQHSLTVSG